MSVTQLPNEIMEEETDAGLTTAPNVESSDHEYSNKNSSNISQIFKMGQVLPAEKSSKTSKSITPVDAQPFPFMRLPFEIRMMVYMQHFIQPGEIVVKHANYPLRGRLSGSSRTFSEDQTKKMRGLDQWIVLGIRTASRAVFEETAQLYFRHNAFAFRSIDLMRAFLNRIPVTDRRAIRSVSFQFEGKAPAMGIKALATCVGLQRLEIAVNWLTSYPRLGPLTSAFGMRDLLKIRGIKELVVHKLPLPHENMPSRYEGYDEFVQALQVLKQPCSRARLNARNRLDGSSPPQTESKKKHPRKAKVETGASVELEGK